MDWRTPLGLTHVIGKQKDPTWYRQNRCVRNTPPTVIRYRERASGPGQSARAYAMRLAAGNGTYLIHGTNNPKAVGMPVTHGCIRMYPDDVQALFPLVPVGTPVRLINEPIKVAWVDGELLLEAHPPVDAEGQSFEPNVEQFSELLQKAVGDTTVAIHWDYAREVLQKADGVIATVGLEAENPDEPAPPSVTTSPAPAPLLSAVRCRTERLRRSAKRIPGRGAVPATAVSATAVSATAVSATGAPSAQSTLPQDR